MQTRVLKIGGASLFAPSKEFARLLDLLQREHSLAIDRTFIIVGGGDTVESMRTLQTSFPTLDPQAMHWRCVRLLEATWEVATELIEFGQPLHKEIELHQALSNPNPNTYIVNVNAYYTPSLSALQSNSKDFIAITPENSWNTTTDALAWWLAYLIDADQVILVKKKPCEAIHSLAQAAREGVVDSEIARMHEAARHIHNSTYRLPSIQFLFENPDWKYHILED